MKPPKRKRKPSDLAPLPAGSQGWGLFDTRHKNWLSPDKHEGPVTYASEETAKLAARIVDVQLRQPAGQTRATWFVPSRMNKIGEQTILASGEQALKMLEEGRTL